MTIKDSQSSRPTSRYPRKMIAREVEKISGLSRTEKIVITFRSERDPSKRVLSLLVPRSIGIRFHWHMMKQGMVKA